ncbi:putative growth-regulating factor 6 [Cocos nucifera]|nr:putative growth-regulating factor 6 [Cocos nucifera]
MDLGGVVGMEGLVGGASCEGGGLFSSPLAFSDSEIKQTGVFCSSFLKHARPGGSEEDDWRFPKMARTEAMAVPSITRGAASLYRSNSHSLFPEGEQMLSFSSTPSSKPDAMVLSSDVTLPYYHHPSASSSTPYFRNTGLGSSGSNANMNGVLARLRGPFTPSQWMELEHQALIYKYIDANVPIPPSLLVSIRRSFNPSGYPPISAGSFGSSACKALLLP